MTTLTRSGDATNHEVDPSQEGFFNGYVAHGNNSKDPFVSGYAFIKWIKVPTWLEQEGRTFTQLSERNFKGFSGLSTMALDTGGITAGFTANELSFAKGGVTKTEGFTLKYQMKSGKDQAHHYNTWISGIRDPKTGIATYPKKHSLPYHSSNHTAVLLYVVTRPDADNFGIGADKSNIEFAALYTHVMPTKIILDPYNYESGSHEFSDHEQEFKGYMNIGEAVEKFAIEQMSATKVYRFGNENEFFNLNDYAGGGVPSAS